MNRDLARMSETTYDLLVIGGGISGACTAWDATLRGLSVALVEKGDFGEATSSASSKLIHGGIRYLQQGLLGKVRESIVERRRFLRIAPHLVRPVPFLVPAYGRARRGRPVLVAGMTVYELIGLGRNAGLPPSLRLAGFRMLSASEVREREPLVPSEGLTGGVVYPECQMYSSERMTLHFVEGAAARGADVANYLRVDSLLGDAERVTGARAMDVLGGQEVEIRARIVANASGPWAVRLVDLLKGRRRTRTMEHAKGCHLVTDSLTREHALALATADLNESIVNRGGRHVFLIPWRGRTLIGTTNVPYAGHPDDLEVTERDIDDFVAEIARALPEAGFGRDRVHWAFSGLHPIVDADVKEGVYQGSGRYRLWDHSRTDRVEGFVTILGAKFTTARRLAERGIDLVFRKLGHSPPACRTADTPVDGGDLDSFDDYVRGESRHRPFGLEDDVVRDLVHNHGTRWREVMEPAKADPGLLERVAAARLTTRASVRHAARHEMAMTLDDVLFRRTGLGTVGYPGRECLEACAGELADAHGWPGTRVNEEIAKAEAKFGRVA